MRFLFLISLLIGCEQVKPAPSYTHFCAVETLDKRVEFMTACVKNANPMSDEEPEDMIAGCTRATEELFCIWSHAAKAKEYFDARKQTMQGI